MKRFTRRAKSHGADADKYIRGSDAVSPGGSHTCWTLYHRLFAHPRMVRGLVREFVPRGLVADLDFSALQRVNPKFHSGQHEGYERLRGLFAELIHEIFAGRGVKLPKSGSLSQMKTMLSTQYDVWKEQWLAEGARKGRGRGRGQGRGTHLSPGGEIRRGGAVLAEANPWSQAGNP